MPPPSAYPQPPAQLMQPSEALQPLAPGATVNDALGVVTANYGVCHATAERLSALQAWVRAQAGAMSR